MLALETIFDDEIELELFLRSIAVYLSVILLIVLDDNLDTFELEGISFNNLNNNG